MTVCCYDCGLPYQDPGFADLVVAHEVWDKISPTSNEGGLLCPTCMVRAAHKAGLREVYASFESGPFCVSYLPVACEEKRLQTPLSSKWEVVGHTLVMAAIIATVTGAILDSTKLLAVSAGWAFFGATALIVALKLRQRKGD